MRGLGSLGRFPSRQRRGVKGTALFENSRTRMPSLPGEKNLIYGREESGRNLWAATSDNQCDNRVQTHAQTTGSDKSRASLGLAVAVAVAGSTAGSRPGVIGGSGQSVEEWSGMKERERGR